MAKKVLSVARFLDVAKKSDLIRIYVAFIFGTALLKHLEITEVAVDGW